MAHAGPETAGSQFFVTLSAQPHLDGAYTAFGRVVAGAGVLHRLLQGRPDRPPQPAFHPNGLTLRHAIRPKLRLSELQPSPETCVRSHVERRDAANRRRTRGVDPGRRQGTLWRDRPQIPGKAGQLRLPHAAQQAGCARPGAGSLLQALRALDRFDPEVQLLDLALPRGAERRHRPHPQAAAQVVSMDRQRHRRGRGTGTSRRASPIPYQDARNVERGSPSTRRSTSCPANTASSSSYATTANCPTTRSPSSKGMPLGTVKNKLFRGRQMLKEQLSDFLTD